MRHFYPAEPNCLLAHGCFYTRSNSLAWRSAEHARDVCSLSNNADGPIPQTTLVSLPVAAAWPCQHLELCLPHWDVSWHIPTQIRQCMCTLNDTWWTISSSPICSSCVLAASNCESTAHLTRLNDLFSVSHTAQLSVIEAAFLTAWCPHHHPKTFYIFLSSPVCLFFFIFSVLLVTSLQHELSFLQALH